MNLYAKLSNYTKASMHSLQSAFTINQNLFLTSNAKVDCLNVDEFNVLYKVL